MRAAQVDDPNDDTDDTGADFIGALTQMAAFDLAQGNLHSFGPFRFLYERLAGASIRPWLPSAFVGAAAMPHIDPAQRKALLQSLSEAAATAPGWSTLPPRFFPEHIAHEAA